MERTARSGKLGIPSILAMFASNSNSKLNCSRCLTHPPPGEWLLLYFYDGENQELRSEFSRPAALSEDGEVEAWDVRVLLEPTYPDFAMVQPSLFGTEDDDIDFAISRASGD